MFSTGPGTPTAAPRIPGMPAIPRLHRDADRSPIKSPIVSQVTGDASRSCDD